MSVENIKLSRWYTYGDHYYRRAGDVEEVIFENTALGITKTIIENSGKIVGFPGVAHPALVSGYSDGFKQHKVKFRSDFSVKDGRCIFIWQIQPDGRYWEDDDGFGGTSDEEINLYAPLDEMGNFTEPFRLYSIGNQELFGTDLEEVLAKAMEVNADPLETLRSNIPAMIKEIRAAAEAETETTVRYNIPGTNYSATISLSRDLDNWYIQTSMSKMFSGVSVIGFLKFLPLNEQRIYLQSDQAVDDAGKELTRLYYQIQKRK